MLAPTLHPHSREAKLAQRELEPVRRLIEAQITDFEPSIQPYLRQVLHAEGKMLRPALVLLCAEATGGIRPEHQQFAALIEMVHVASLVHDDVLDVADLRRQQPTANALWGNSLAVLLGDLVLSQAMLMGTHIGQPGFSRRMAQAVKDLCQGEVLQSSCLWEDTMSREEYFKLIRLKTATLFSAATAGAAALQGLDEEAVARFEQFGMLLGVAYQIYDDCLDVSGKDAVAGKTLGTDASKGKLTLPVFCMLESEDEELSSYVRSCIAHREAVDYDKLRALPSFHIALKASVDEGCRYNDEARSLLLHLPNSRARQALFDLIDRFDQMLRDQI